MSRADPPDSRKFDGLVADLESGGQQVASCGARVRVPTACGGCSYNPNGLMDTQASAAEVDQRLSAAIPVTTS